MLAIVQADAQDVSGNQRREQFVDSQIALGDAEVAEQISLDLQRTGVINPPAHMNPALRQESHDLHGSPLLWRREDKEPRAPVQTNKEPARLSQSCGQLTEAIERVTVFVLRVILVIFALWVLVIEPTFRAFEQAEQQSANHEPTSGESYQDIDQPIPPGEVVAPQWINEHFMAGIAMPLPDFVDLAWSPDRLNSVVSPIPVLDELCLPYPAPALPLRL